MILITLAQGWAYIYMSAGGLGVLGGQPWPDYGPLYGLSGVRVPVRG